MRLLKQSVYALSFAALMFFGAGTLSADDDIEYETHSGGVEVETEIEFDDDEVEVEVEIEKDRARCEPVKVRKCVVKKACICE